MKAYVSQVVYAISRHLVRGATYGKVGYFASPGKVRGLATGALITGNRIFTGLGYKGREL